MKRSGTPGAPAESGQRMLLLIDENVPASVSGFYASRGHDVQYVRDLPAAGAADPVIATTGNILGAVVVTWNHKHFKALVSRFPGGNRQRLRNLGRITYTCPEPFGLRRTAALIESIEFEYAQVRKMADKRLMFEVGTTTFRVFR